MRKYPVGRFILAAGLILAVSAMVTPFEPATAKAGKKPVHHIQYERRCTTNDLIGYWTMVDFDSSNPNAEKDSHYVNESALGYQIYSFDKRGKFKFGASESGIDQSEYNKFQLLPADSDYKLETSGKLKLMTKSADDKKSKPLYYACTLITKDMADKDGIVVKDKGNLLFRYWGKDKKPLYEKQLKRINGTI